MTPREKFLAILIGGSIGLAMLYQVVNFVFISPLTKAETDIENLTRESDRLDGIIRSRRSLAERWLAYASRTISFDRPEASNRFAQELKELAGRHQFTNPIFSPVSGSKLGDKTDVSTIGYRFAATGAYRNAVAFVRDLYRSPYYSAITKMSIAPLLQRNLPMDTIKLEFTIETPVLPVIDKKTFQEVATASTLSQAEEPKTDPAREFLRSDESFALLDRRNIFKPYIAPPQNVVMLDNQDWKTVAAKVRFYWDGEVFEQKVETVSSKAQQAVKGMGDIVEIEGSYADGKTFGPQRLDFSTRQDWTYAIPVHSPAPPPTVVILAVDNKDKNIVDFDVTVVKPDGSSQTFPTMRAKPGSVIDVGQFEAKHVTISATYGSGKKHPPMNLTPRPDKQVYTIPVEPAEQVAVVSQPVSDPPADPQYTVSGLVTYRGQQEMIVTGNANARAVIPVGEKAAVDGGDLLGVHPLGGVVKMPSGNFYLYPLGRKYTDRVKLEAAKPEDLPRAIDSWAMAQ
ncbi:MAG: hypothetical protein HS101_10030 [Planctomycetia bacterium]|jgi:hypothetical protein|nr:hypothetical protein [Planctomycetia bacterium]MCC7315741.1 hypothetical protein [Planctomycetota bacterium]OQZ04152.1 MAG: hypothetical protein B6D36_12085 [Planctomycetes bacterium UTPLA1]